MEEIWKDIPGYEGRYQASNLGRIRSLDCRFVRKNGWPFTKKGKILSPQVGKVGYPVVNICGKMLYVHRIVADIFCENRSDSRNHVDHLNSIRTDNRAENLEWVSQKENNRRQSHPSKLVASDIRHIRDEYDRLSQKRKYGVLAKIAKGYGVDVALIHRICIGKSWSHVK